jgi:hypothetical protein
MARSTTDAFARTGRQVQGTARDALRSPWVERLARLGFAARGAVYALVGLLAVQTALGARHGQTTDTHGVLQVVADKSQALIWALAVGLFGYALWRVVQGVLDPERKGSDPKGLAQRAGQIGIGVIYGSFAWAAVKTAMGAHADSGGGSQAQWTAKLMSAPMGRWLVAAVGIGIIIAGGAQIWRGWNEKFRKHLKLQEMDPSEQRLAIHTGKAGMIARGIVFLLSGWFVVQAALRFDSSQARGLSGALDALARQPHGQILLGLVALGLICFGAYSILLARYRRIVF